jgi:hypothetical protein
MEAKYFVPKHEVPYDSIGNENKGVYRQYIIELTVRNDRGEIGFTYIGHTEVFYRETDAWENENDFIMEKEPDLSEWRQVSGTECSEPDGWTFFTLDKLIPKKMFKYVESFDEVEK